MKKIKVLQQLLFILMTGFATSAADAASINNSTEALAYVLEGDRVPNAAKVKLEALKATQSAKTQQWEFTFRDEDKQYKATVNAAGDFKLKKKFDENGLNPEFWATFPAPALPVTAEQMLEKAKSVIDSFNPTFKAQDKAIVEMNVCKPPKKGKTSKYSNGCQSDQPKEVWSVSVQVESEGKTFYRNIEFQNGHPLHLSKINIFGNW